MCVLICYCEHFAVIQQSFTMYFELTSLDFHKHHICPTKKRCPKVTKNRYLAEHYQAIFHN